MAIRSLRRDGLMRCKPWYGRTFCLPQIPGRSSVSQRTILGWFGSSSTDEKSFKGSTSTNPSSNASVHSESNPSIASDAAKPSVELLEERLAQDPRGRIRVLRPFDQQRLKRGSWKSIPYGWNVKAFDGFVGLDEAHCLPFWTMVYITAWHRKSLDKISGTTDTSWQLDVTDLGFSVCAVADDHWASGLVLTDDARELLDAQFGMQDFFGLQSPDHYRDWTKSNPYVETSVPPFAKGYPKFTEEQLIGIFQRTAEDQSRRRSETNLRWLVELREPVRTLAIPTYRPVFKKNFADGRMGYWDGWRPPVRRLDASAHHFKLPRDKPKAGFDAMSSYGPTNQSNFRSWDHGKWANEAMTDEAREAIEEVAAFALAQPPTSHIRLVEEIDKAMEVSKVDWEDPNILPADIGSGPNLRAVIKYATQHILGFDMGKLPQAFKRVAKPVQATPIIRKSVVKRQPSLSARTAGASSGSQSSTMSKTLPGARPRTPPPSTARPPLGRIPALGSLPPARKPAEVILDVKDSEGYYADLDVTPNSDFFTLTARTAVIKQLDQAKRTMQFVHHPDRQRSRALLQDDSDKGSPKGSAIDRSQAVNVAHARLKTINMRREYQGLTRLPQPEADL